MNDVAIQQAVFYFFLCTAHFIFLFIFVSIPVLTFMVCEFISQCISSSVCQFISACASVCQESNYAKNVPIASVAFF